MTPLLPVNLAAMPFEQQSCPRTKRKLF